MAYGIQDTRSGNTPRYSPTSTNPLGTAATTATTTPASPPAYMPQSPNVPNPAVFKPQFVNNNYSYATLDTANQMAQMFGGKVVEQNSGLPGSPNPVQYNIVMPNGSILNAGWTARELYPDDPNLQAVSPDQRLAQVMADIQHGAGDFGANIYTNQPAGGYAATPEQSAQVNANLAQYYKDLGLNPSGLANNATPAKAFGVNTQNPLLGAAPQSTTTPPPAQTYATPTNNVGQNQQNQQNQQNTQTNGLTQNALMGMLLNMFGLNTNSQTANGGSASSDPFMQMLLLSLLGGNFMNPQYRVGASPLGYTQWML